MITGRAGGVEASLRRTELWERFELQLALADVPLSATHVAMLTGAGTLLVALVATAIAGPVGLLLAATVPVGVYMFVKSRLQRRRAKFAEQLPDNLQVIASALRAGHSLVGALAVLTEDVAEPSQTEFRRVLADEQVGVPLEDALADVGVRMDSRDLAQISVVAALQRETGGNSAEVIDRVTETIRQRFELRRLVKTLTTQGRMSRWVVSLLPIVLFFVINLINPDYMKPLYEHSGGRVLIVVAALMVCSGSYVIKRIVTIKV
jgi:tight adherence protein B